MKLASVRRSAAFYCFRRNGHWNLCDAQGGEFALAANIAAGNITSLSPDFLRINNSAIVSLRHLRFVENNTRLCTLSVPIAEGVELRVSREVLRRLRERVCGM